MKRWQRLALRHAGWAGKVAAGLTLVLTFWMLASGRHIVSALGLLLPLWLSLAATTVAIKTWARWQRERLIREAPLPQFLKRKLREAYPQLTGKDGDLAERALRQFFFACQRSQGAFVAMPSRAVDAMWHAFIVHTQAYQDWCELTLGRFLHHTPAEALGPRAINNDGLRRAWFWACRDEAIDPRAPTRLPLLFALDAKLGIAGGFRYVPDCRAIERAGRSSDDGGGSSYCGTDFSDGSFSGDGDGMGGADAGDGGGGDGGGGGGGGD